MKMSEISEKEVAIDPNIRKDFEAQALPQLANLYRTAMYMADDELEARELVIETVVTAYQSWPKYQFESNGRIKIFTVMANTISDKHPSSSGLNHSLNGSEATDETGKRFRKLVSKSVVKTVHDQLSSISDDDVKSVVRNLPFRYRLSLILSLLEGFSYQEISDIAGIELSAVIFNIREGRKLIHRYLLNQLKCKDKNELIASRVGGGGMSS